MVMWVFSFFPDYNIAQVCYKEKFKQSRQIYKRKENSIKSCSFETTMVNILMENPSRIYQLFQFCVQFPEGVCLYFYLWVFTPWGKPWSQRQKQIVQGNAPHFLWSSRYLSTQDCPLLHFSTFPASYFHLPVETLHALSTLSPFAETGFLEQTLLGPSFSG